MSIRLMSQAWEHSQAKGNALLVLLAIADCANDQGLAWPSVKTLAKKARVDRTTAMRHVAELEEMHELTVDRTTGVANRYVVTLTNQSEGATGGELRLVATSDGTSRTSATPTSRGCATRTISRTKKKRVCHFEASGFSLTDENRGYAQERGQDAAVELEKFADYHSAKGSRFSNWDAAWRNWIRRAALYAKHNATPAPRRELRDWTGRGTA